MSASTNKMQKGSTKSSQIAIFVCALLFFQGSARAETFSAVMLAERKPGIDDATWNGHANVLPGTLVFPVAPTSTTTDSTEVRWVWDGADSGDMTADEVREILENFVTLFNNPANNLPSAFSLQWGNGTGTGIPVPSELAATDDRINDIVVSWSHSESSGYSFNVYRSINASFDDSTIIGNAIESSPFNDADVVAGEVYYYWVVAIRISDGEESAPGGFVIGAVAEVVEEIPIVTGLRGSRSGDGFLVYWNEIEESGYQYVVFRDGVQVALTLSPYLEREMEEGLIYFFSVAAMRLSDFAIGPQSEFVVGSIVGEGLDGKLRISAENGFNTTYPKSIHVGWNNPTGIRGDAYEVYRSESNNFDQAVLVSEENVIYSEAGDILYSPIVFIDTSIEEGKAYFYWVVIRDFDGSEIMRSDSDSGFFGLPGADPDCVEPEAGPQLFSIAQRAFLKASNTGGGDQFGYAVALDGDIAVVGAPGEDSSSRGVGGQQSDENAQRSGAVYVLSRDPQSGAWTQEAYLKPPVTSSGANAAFGQSVAISGNTVVVGAPGDQDFQGRAYVYIKQGGAWSQQATLVASDPEASQWGEKAIPQFGHAVAIDGETILVGAPTRDAKMVSALPAYPYPAGYSGALGRTGAAYVFTRSSGNWSQRKVLVGSNTNQAVAFYLENPDAVSDEFMIARFEELNALWGCDKRWWEGVRFAQDPHAVYFGFSVALSGGIAVIGSPGDKKPETGVHDGTHMGCPSYGPAYGSASVFEGAGAVWNQTAYLKTPTLQSGTGFGRSVAVDGRTVVIGAPYDGSNATAVDGGHNSSAPLSGAAYVFVSDSVGSPWRQQAFLKSTHAAHTTADGRSVWFFGASLALQGDKLLVAAPTMVRGGCVKSGVAYLFGRQGETWSQQALVRPTAGGDEFDLFGGEVRHGSTGLAMDGDTLLVGAPGEDSNAKGVDGDESVNGSADSGAAYVFSLAAATAGYTEWATSMGLPADPSAAANDSNSNGVADIFEYLLKLPAGNPAEGLPNTIREPSEEGLPVFTFTLAAGSHPDAVLKIRASETMLAGSWQVIATKNGDESWSGSSVVRESVQQDGSKVITVAPPWMNGTNKQGFFQLEAMLR